MEYTLINTYGKKVIFVEPTHSQLEEEYNLFSSASDDYWMSNLPKILHHCIVLINCYGNWQSAFEATSDVGILHLMSHLLDIPDEPLVTLKEARDCYENTFSRYFK